eukprot:TRINITY_DN67513_c1_g1_i14.p1 TRINITY_DN67513_c1_g1~~TRINITY_DN67513_c1_g1_i14.p1  ORF type:complete len:212 (-),score=33.85 TRINITY_DN67513_c1_g1_i14:188-823(-)
MEMRKGNCGTVKQMMSELLSGVLCKQQSLHNEQEEWNSARDTVKDINLQQQQGNEENGNPDNNDQILCLDVGGTKIHISQSKLRRSAGGVSDSMLGVWLSGDWEWSIEKEEEDGMIFIDRDGSVFQQGGVLDFLRDGNRHVLFDEQQTPKHWWWNCLSSAERKLQVRSWLLSLHKESVYFGLSSLSTWCEEHQQLLDKKPVFTHHGTHRGP